MFARDDRGCKRSIGGGAARGESRALGVLFFLPFLLLGNAHFFVELVLEVVGGLPKLSHQLAHLACELRGLFRTEQHKSKNEDKDRFAKVHRPLMIPAASFPVTKVGVRRRVDPG